MKKLGLTLLLALALLLAAWSQLIPTSVVAATPTPIVTIIPSPTLERPSVEQMSFMLTVDPPLQSGRPGETLIYTMTLKNTGALSDTYFLYAEATRGRQFDLSAIDPDTNQWALYYSSDSANYSGILVNVEPGEQHTIPIRMSIPSDATNEMENRVLLRAHGAYTGSVQLQFSAVVSTPTAIRQVGHLGFSAQDVAVQGNYAYVAAGSEGLRIVDISKPDQLVDLGAYEAPDAVVGVSIVGDYAYVAAGEAGLRVVDISNPVVPLEVGFYETTEIAQKVSVVDNRAYIIWDECWGIPCSSKLGIVDISTPTHPLERGSYPIPSHIEGMAIEDNYAYLISGIGGFPRNLDIVDLSNPVSPRSVAIHELPSDSHDIVVAKGYAYLANSDKGLRVIDVSNPTVPIDLGTYETSKTAGYAVGVFLKEDQVYLTSFSGLSIFDISKPDRPLNLGFYKTFALIEGLVVRNNLAYLAVSSDGFQVVDLSHPTTPIQVGEYGARGFAQAVAIAGNYAYLADKDRGLRVIDVSNPTAPTEIAVYKQRGGAWDVKVKGDYVYVLFDNCEVSYSYRHSSKCDPGLSVLDISTPTAPVEIALYDLPEGEDKWEKMKILGDNLYINDRTNRLHVLDISNPATLVETITSGEQIRDFVIANSYLYTISPYKIEYTADGKVTSESWLDILNPESLTKVHSYRLPVDKLPQELGVVGHYALIDYILAGCAECYYSLLIVNISNPVAPFLVDDVKIPLFDQDAFVTGSYAYSACGEQGLRIADISNPDQPVEVDAFGAPGAALDVAVANGYIYLANGSGGLDILRYPGAE